MSLSSSLLTPPSSTGDQSQNSANKAFFDKTLTQQKEEKDIETYKKLNADTLLAEALKDEKVAVLVLKNKVLLDKLGRYDQNGMNNVIISDKYRTEEQYKALTRLIDGGYVFQLCDKFKDSTTFKNELNNCRAEIESRLAKSDVERLFPKVMYVQSYGCYI